MTTLAHSAGRGAFARRLAFLEPSMALWVVLIAVLVFLIASPMVRLVIASFQEPETGRFTLANYVEACGSLRSPIRSSSASALHCSPACSACRSPGRSRAPTCRPRDSCA
jgi:hypothetical protein